MSTYGYVDGEADAFRSAQGQGRKPVQRRTVDYTATTVRHIEVRARSVNPALISFVLALPTYVVASSVTTA